VLWRTTAVDRRKPVTESSRALCSGGGPRSDDVSERDLAARVRAVVVENLPVI